METLKTLRQKLFDIQQEIGAIKKDSTNPHFKNTYFDINTLIDVLKPLLKKHELFISQPLTHIEGKTALSTIITDTLNNQEMGFTVPIPENADPQKMGSTITYFRRYALTSLLLLESTDDDGNHAAGHSEKPTVAKNVPTGAKSYTPAPKGNQDEVTTVIKKEVVDDQGYPVILVGEKIRSWTAKASGKQCYAVVDDNGKVLDDRWLKAAEYDQIINQQK